MLYTGDYSMEDDRHLMAAEMPSTSPDVLIVEATYGVQVGFPSCGVARLGCAAAGPVGISDGAGPRVSDGEPTRSAGGYHYRGGAGTEGGADRVVE